MHYIISLYCGEKKPRGFQRSEYFILSRCSSRHCAVSANAIASQLIRNDRYKGIDRESSRLIWQEVSDLWMATPTSPVNISKSFTSQVFAAALKHLKPGKAPGPDSIFPELISDARAGMKSWLCGFLSSCLRHLKIPNIWRRTLLVAIPKPKKPVEDPKNYRRISLLCVPLTSSRGLYTLVLSRLLTHFSLGSKLHPRGMSTVDHTVLLTQNIQDWCRVCRSDSCLRHCLAPRSHLQVA